MAASKEKCGQRHQDTSEIGEITARKASASSSTRTVTNTKACGPWTRSMVKEPTGGMRVTSWEESIPAIGSRTRSMEEVPSSSRMETDTTATGSMACPKVKEEWSTQMETSTKVSGTKEKETDMEYWQREMEITLKAIGSMTTERDKAHISIVTRISCSLESGLTINQKLVCTQRSKMTKLTMVQRDHTSRIPIYFLKFQNWNLPTQLLYWRKPWRGPRESDLILEYNIFHLKKCSPLKNWWI